MKAWVLHGVNDLRFQEVAQPVPGEGEVLIRVKAVGICGSDIPRIYQTGAHTHPLIPGHEFSGVVEGLGAGVEDGWLGAQVGVFPLLPCKACGPCRNRQYEMCRNYNYLGSRRDGGFAEYVTVPVWNLLRLPKEVTFEEAPMLEPMSVAVHAMRRIRPSKRDTVAVCGLGTIGLLLVMFLKAVGIQKLLLIGKKESQKRAVQRLGFAETVYCDCQKEDASRWIFDHTEGRGVDVFFECVGKKETYELAVKTTAPAGKVLLTGNPYSDMGLPKEVYWKILRNQLTITGTWNSGFFHDLEDDWHYVLKQLIEKKIAPTELITHRFSLEELEKGLRIMRDKTEDYEKMIIE